MGTSRVEKRQCCWQLPNTKTQFTGITQCGPCVSRRALLASRRPDFMDFIKLCRQRETRGIFVRSFRESLAAAPSCTFQLVSSI